MNQTREFKQNYLKQEIIDKSYSPEEFLNYCNQFRGSDIDAYTFEELQSVVVNFQQLKISPPLPPEPQISSKYPVLSQPDEEFISKPQPPQKQIEIQSKQIETQSKPIEIHPSRQSDSIAYSIQSCKMEDNILSLEEIITVTLGPVEEVSGKVLGTKQMYPVTTEPFGWVVKRQPDDFVWLRMVLSCLFPGVYLPPSPPKRFRNSGDASSKQQYFLERFINCIVRNPLLRRCTYLEAFLMDNDDKSFGDMKKRGIREKRINRIEEFWTMDGSVICDPFNDESEKVSLCEYLSVVEAMKKKIKRQSDEVIQALKGLSGLVMDIAKSYETLENVQNFIPEVTGFKPLYSSLRSSFVFWSEHELKSAELLKNYFNMFFKYGYYEVGPLKEMFHEREQKRDQMLKTDSKLNQKKEKLWVAGDVSKWGLTNEDLWNASALKNDKTLALSKMCRKDQDDLDRLKDEFAYINFQSKSEMRKFLLDNQLIENLHFADFAKSICNHTTKFHANWGDLIANLSRIRTENIPLRSYISKVPKNT